MARDAPVIETYGQGGFRLSGVRYEGSVLILSDEARLWPVRNLADLTVDAVKPVLDAGRTEVEFLLLGVGVANALPSRPVRDALARAGLGLEFMDTPSAARLYNVLTSEGRRVAAGLIAV